MTDVGERELIDALRRGERELIPVPPGRAAVDRESVLVELGIAAEDSAELDGLYEQIGVDLLAVERKRSQGLGATRPARTPAPTVVYVCPARLLD